MSSFRWAFGGFAVVLLALALHAADRQALEVRSALLQTLEEYLKIDVKQASTLIDSDSSVTQARKGFLDYLRAAPGNGQCGGKLKEGLSPSAQQEVDSILWPPGNTKKGTSCHDLNYFRTINMIATAILLLIPGVGIFVARYPDGQGPGWAAIWTGTYIAFLLHLYYGIGGIFGGDFALITHDVSEPPRVTHPRMDTFTAAWWTLDVVLAWSVNYRFRLLLVVRSAFVAFLLISALGSSVLMSSNGYVPLIGIALAVSTLAAAVYRVCHHCEPDCARRHYHQQSFCTELESWGRDEQKSSVGTVAVIPTGRLHGTN